MCRTGSIPRGMPRSRLVLLTLLAAALAPATASAACPNGPGTVWVDYAAYAVYDTPVESVLARPGTLLAVQNPKWRDSYQAKGADTVGWYMRLLSIVGTVNDPKPRSQVLAKVPQLATLAREMTSCTRPWLTLNEMQAVQVDEPATYAQRRFRANVLALAKALDNRGVRVLLLMPRIPLREDALSQLLARAVDPRRPRLRGLHVELADRQQARRRRCAELPAQQVDGDDATPEALRRQHAARRDRDPVLVASPRGRRAGGRTCPMPAGSG